MSSPGEREGERSLGGLFAELAGQTASLVQQEVALARDEMTDKARDAIARATVVGTGSALVHVAVVVLCAAAVAGLGTVMPVWMAALAVGLVMLLAGIAVTRAGMAGLRAIDPKPHKTLRALEENKLWAKKELSR